MTITLNDVAARADYVASAGQTVYPLTFKFFAATDLLVFVNGAQRVVTTDFTAQGVNADSGMQITLLAPSTAGDKISIVRVVPYDRTAQLPISGPFQVDALNLFLTKLVAMIQQVRDKAAAAIGLDVATNSVFDARNIRITNVATPTAPADAATKAYVDTSPVIAGYANAASASAGAAAGSATQASTYLANLMTAYNNFIDSYLGAHSTAPSVDGQGLPIGPGDLYYDTSVPGMFVYTGTAWVAAYVTGTQFLPLHGTADAASSLNTGGFNSIFAYGSVGFVVQGATGSTSVQLQLKYNAGNGIAGYLYGDSSGMTWLTSTASNGLHQDNSGNVTVNGQLGAAKGGSDLINTINQTDASTTNTFRPVLQLQKAGAARFQVSVDGSAANAGVTYYETFGPGYHAHQFFVNGGLKANVDVTGITSTAGVADVKGDVRKVIQNAVPVTYTAVLSDGGKSLVGTNANTNITIPANVFNAGDALTIVNYNTNTNFTITQGASLSLVYAANPTLTTGNRTLASNGMCSLLFLNPTTAYISGAGLS